MNIDKPESDENAQQTSSEPEMVEIHEAGVEDLDAALANAQAEESAIDSGETVDTPAQPVSSNTNQVPESQPVESAQAAPAGVVPPGATPSNPGAQRVYTQDEIQGILAENARQKKEGDQKELFIQHRGNELGRLRAEYALTKRQLAEARAQLANGLEDRFHENPVQASNDRDRIKEIDQQLEGLSGQEDRAARIVEAQTFFLRNVDTENVSLDEVADVLRLDNVDERYIAQFKANPWEFTTPEALVQMGKRAMDLKVAKKADEDRRLLARHVLYLNDQLAKQKARPGQVMAQVQRNLNQSPGVTAASNVSHRSAQDVDPGSITRMSISELDAALKNATSH